MEKTECFSHGCTVLLLKFRCALCCTSLQLYCLKDCDFEKQCGPPLPYLMRRNPHHPHGGSMTLYLEKQVHAHDNISCTPCRTHTTYVQNYSDTGDVLQVHQLCWSRCCSMIDGSSPTCIHARSVQSSNCSHAECKHKELHHLDQIVQIS